MKPTNALVIAMLAGLATFFAQYDLFPARLHAAALHVPTGPDWRQKMLDGYPGGAKVEHAVDRLSKSLDLSSAQAQRARSILQRQHERILGLLVAGPRSMTRGEFVVAEHEVWADTCQQLDAMLTPDQLQLAHELRAPDDGSQRRYLFPA